MCRETRYVALFREVNDRIREVSAGWDASEPLDFVCECGSDTCTASVTLPLPDYDAVRALPSRYVLLKGHQSVDDAVVGTNNGYVVVERASEAAAA